MPHYKTGSQKWKNFTQKSKITTLKFVKLIPFGPEENESPKTS